MSLPIPTRRRSRRPLLWLPALLLFVAACGEEGPPHPSGTFEADEVDLSARLSAPCLEVRVDEGDRVAAGDTLVVLDTEILSRQRAQAAARSRTLQARRGAAEADLRRAREEQELAEITLRRLSSLQEQGSATAQQVDEARSRRDVSISRVEAARQQRTVIAAQQEEVDAQLRVFDRQLEDGALLAPLDATVLIRAIEPGEMASPQRLALRLADLSHVELRVYLEAEDLDRVRLGEPYPVRVDALGDETVEGVVAWVSEVAEFTPDNVQTRDARAQLVYAVELRVANPDGRLKIGMPAELVLEEGASR